MGQTMDCQMARKWISRELDRELTRAEAEALDAHLDGCALCRREHDELQRLQAALTAMAEPKEPPGTAKRLAAALRGAQARPAHRVTLPYRLTSLAAMALLAAGVVWLAVQMRETRRESARLKAQLVRTLERPHSHDAMRTAFLITPAERVVAEQLQAFGAVRDYLGGAVRWMATDDEEVEVGMSAAPPARAAPARQEVLVLNFEYVEQAAGRRAHVMSNPQFVMFPGEEASVRLKGHAGDEPVFRYRVKAERLIDGRVRAEVSFAHEAPAAQEINTTIHATLQLSPGKPVLLGASGDAAHRWELYLWGVTRPVNGAPSNGEKGSL